MKLIIIGIVAVVFIVLLVWGIRTGLQNKNAVPTLEEFDRSIEIEGEQEPATITTPEGVSYKDLRAGTGETAEKGDVATVHYVGALENGSVFDASTGRGEPFSFRIGAGDVIAGWEIGIVGMKEGGIRELTIPPALGYGDQERGPIPAGSTLLFTVQLIEVQKGN